FTGGYDSALVLSSNDPDAPSTSMPAHLQVTGAPELDVSPTALNFGAVFVDGSSTLDVDVHNAGTDTLTVWNISSDDPDFTPAELGFTVAPGQTHALAVTFAPHGPGPAGATLTLASNDADEPDLALPMQGVGLEAPDIGISPSSFDESLVTGETASRTLTLANTGGATLSWRLSRGGSLSLEDVRDRLEEGAGSVTDAIPARYLFFEGESGNTIVDGGNDMYDGGNLLGTDLGGPVSYTDGPIVSSGVFGANGRYFTRKFPGLFVLAADLSGVTEFRIEGDLGADGGGLVDGSVLEATVGGVHYAAFVKRVFSASDPSVNHLIVVEQRPGLQHQFPANTNDDRHSVFDLSGSTRLYYLLYAGSGGRYIDDLETRGILNAFLDLLGPQWLSVGPPQEGTLLPGDQATIPVGFDATGMIGGDYGADIVVTSNDPDAPEVAVPVRLHVTGAADVDVAPLSVDFGSVFVGGTASRTVTVRNLGTDALHVSGVTFDHGDFAADAGSFSLPVEGSRDLTLTFTPGTAAPAAATMTLASDDPDEPSVFVSLQGVGLVPPVVGVSPQSFSESLFTGASVTRTLTLQNTGGSPLDYEIFLRSAPPATAPAAAAPFSGSYSGTHLAFGITDYGEVMPFQSPPGIEHLRWGNWMSGHTVAYVAGGQDHVCYAVYEQRSCLVPESSREVRNTPTEAELEVVSRTLDGALRLTQTFTFVKATRYVHLNTRVTNLTGASVSDVVLKWMTDWDVQGVFNNTWDYDRERNAVLAWEGSYVAVAGVEEPALMDLDGWNDFSRRATEVGFPSGPVDFDGASLLHFQLGALGAGASREVSIVYAAGPDLATLREAIDAGRNTGWVRLEPVSGSVPAGAAATVQVTFDATGLNGGDYGTAIVVATNDPGTPEVAVPAHLHVTGAPDLQVTADLIDFGEVFVGAVTSRTFSVTNAGTDRLTVSAVGLEHRDFATDRTSFALAVGETRTLTVFFGPIDRGPTSTTLTFTSDDPDEPTVAVALQGSGVEAPVLLFSPAAFTESLLTGETVTRTLTILNRGASDLTFSVAVASAARDEARPAPVPPSTPPPSRGAGPRYDEGATPGRPPQVHAAPPPGPRLGTFPVLLVQAGGEPDDLRERLLEFPDITDVDVFDARAGTPTLDQLRPYRAVLLADEIPFASPVALGNVLADYVDAGGGVVLLLAS
ncbi:MAG TPA: choice-of-anchor D domain-containing protein, partial [Candidatus Polarisedimenticolaceae bacterium]|nr:choice-of-anchor D domain-containing protein [Candidatus Polarisedimenticolaceae bacterium]